MKIKLLLLSLVSIIVLMACGEKKEEKKEEASSGGKEVVLKMSALESGYGDKMWPEIIEEYKKVNPNVKIELTQAKDIEASLPAKFQAEDYPDVIMLAMGRKDGIPENFVKEKELADLTPVMDTKVPGEEKTVKEKLLDGFTGNTITNPYSDGKVYLMPMFYSPTGLFYNKALFEKNGWQVPTTWDEMFALAEKAKEKKISLFTYPTTGYLDSFLPSIIAGKGGEQLFKDTMNFKEGIWNSPEMTEVFATLGKIAKYVEPTTVANATNEGFKKNQQLVLDDKALFMPNGSWIVGEMAETTPKDFKWGMAPYPAFAQGGDKYALSYFEQIWVPKEAKNIKEAQEFIAFLYSDKAAEIFAKYNAVQPISNYPYDKLSEENRIFYDIYKNGAKALVGGFATTKPVEGIDFKGTLYGTFNSVVNGTKTPEQWQKEVNEMMEKLRVNLMN